jgi:hypothetical protein
MSHLKDIEVLLSSLSNSSIVLSSFLLCVLQGVDVK